MVKGEDCQIRVVKRACGYDAGLWYKTFAQRMSQPVKELIDCRSTSHVAGYDSDYDSDYDADDDDNTHHRKRVLLLILAPIGGFIGFLILLGIVCAARRQQNEQRQSRALSVNAAQTGGISRALIVKMYFLLYIHSFVI